MSDLTHFSFLSLSAELRHEVYRHLISLTLDAGNPMYLVGLFLSCRTIHYEIEWEYMKNIHVLLQAQREWLGVGREPGVLRFSAHHSHSGGKKGLHITLLIRTTDQWRQPVPRGFEDDWAYLTRTLEPVFAMRASILTVETDPQVPTQRNQAFVHSMLDSLFGWQRHNDEAPSCSIQHLDRLVVVMRLDDFANAPRTKAYYLYYLSCILTSQLRGTHGYDRLGLTSIRRGWIAKLATRESERWCAIFDFKTDMAVPEGAVLETECEDREVFTRNLVDGDVFTHSLDEPVQQHEFFSAYWRKFLQKGLV